MWARGPYFFWRELPGGRREVSWRVWVLIWVAPVLFLAAALLMQGYEAYRHLAMETAEGEVVRVYAWEGETPFDRGEMQYTPVFRYVWSDGDPTEASAGMRHADWNFEVGSVHEIRYWASAKADVMLPGPVNFYAGWIVGAIGLALLPLALFATWRMRRWQGAGA